MLVGMDLANVKEYLDKLEDYAQKEFSADEGMRALFREKSAAFLQHLIQIKLG